MTAPVPPWPLLILLPPIFDCGMAALIWQVPDTEAERWLQHLTRTDIVAARPGPRGGYTLTAEARRLGEALLSEEERSRGEGLLAASPPDAHDAASAPLDLPPALPWVHIRNLHQLPRPPSDFVGRRDELKRLTQLVKRGTSRIALTGLGGIGKTTLALKVAEELQPLYPEAQLLLSLRGATPAPRSPADAQAFVVRAFDPAYRLPDDPALLADAYTKVLANTRTLLVLDDARDEAQLVPLLPPAGCAAVVTSRRRVALEGFTTIHLDVLSQSEAQTLVGRIAPEAADFAEQIAALCGRLPLALRLAASAIALDEQHDVRAYVSRLDDEAERVAILDQALTWTSARRGIETSLRVSYGMLDPELRARWFDLAVFPDSFDAEAARTIWALDEEARPGLQRLVEYSLLERDETARRFWLHELARLVAGSELDADRQYTCERRHASHYLEVLGRAEQLYRAGGGDSLNGLRLFDAESLNIRTGQAWAAERAPNDKAAAQLCSRYCYDGAKILDLRQSALDRVAWLEAALQAARRIQARSEEAAHIGNLGIASKAIGDVNHAIDLYRHLERIAREVGDERLVDSALTNLGDAYLLSGDIESALSLQTRRLDRARLAGDLSGEGTALGSLGNIHLTLGRREDAGVCYRGQLDIARQLRDRRSEGIALGSLGGVALQEVRFDEAISHYQNAVAVFDEIGDQQAEATQLSNLGDAYLRIGDGTVAANYHLQALMLLRRLGDRVGEAAALGDLAMDYLALGRADDAVSCYTELLGVSRRTGDEQATSRTLGNLGLAYSELGDRSMALACHREAAAIMARIGDRRGEGEALWNVGLTLYALGDMTGAIERAREALVILHEIGSGAARAVQAQLDQWASRDDRR